ncbi:hypothetical protein V1502_08275 [Bacillus sp. SCS-153A]
MNKKSVKVISVLFTIAALLGCHSEKHLSPQLELGETMIIHNNNG